MTHSCIVVGAGPGIGAAVALAFAREGFNLALISRHPQSLLALCTEIMWRTGRTAKTYAADAADSAGLLAALSAAQSELGPAEVLVYNAATLQRGTPLGLSKDQLLKDLAVNVGGALTAAQALAPAMRAQGGGSLLFTGGSLADAPSSKFASLSLGKAALKNLTHTLAQELGEQGIHVGMVTVQGFVQRGTHFDPALIAEHYVQLHQQPRGHFEIERIYK